MNDELVKSIEEILWGGVTPSGKNLKDILMERNKAEIVDVLFVASTSFGTTREMIDNYLMKVVSEFLMEGK